MKFAKVSAPTSHPWNALRVPILCVYSSSVLTPIGTFVPFNGAWRHLFDDNVTLTAEHEMSKITPKWMRALSRFRNLFSFKPRQRAAVEAVATRPIRSVTLAGGTLSLDTRRRLLAAHITQATAKADGSIFYGER